MTEYWYEVLFGSKAVTPAEWQVCLAALRRNLGWAPRWQIMVQCEQNVLHYYLKTTRPLPASLGLANFLFQPVSAIAMPAATWRGICLAQPGENLVSIQARLASKQISLVGLSIQGHKVHTDTQLIYRQGEKTYARTLAGVALATLLSVDFGKSHNLSYKKFPKYLETAKLTKLLSQDAVQAILAPETFPYLEPPQYLPLGQIDFAKHSLILGGSGTGKSKFIASLVRQVHQLDPENYQVVVIDPHAALAEDLADIPDRTVVDFSTAAQSIDLFASSMKNINVGVELMLGLFRSLLDADYNSYLERVLRYSTYLLMAREDFGFASLRRLLLDLDYRQKLVQESRDQVPTNVTQFFLTDFQMLKNQHYAEAIAPVISFIDEMQMLPVFSEASQNVGLDKLLEDRFLSVFSLDRLHLGDRVVQTIAGLLFQQLFLVAQQRQSERQLVIIIDEVAVVENPILARFLAELRKYHVAVVLAGQYFRQISESLRAAILANATNYYMFRVSRADAMLLTEQLELKPALSKDLDDRIKLLTDLKLRECLVKADTSGAPLPAFKARTLDYAVGTAVPARPIPRKAVSGSLAESLEKFFVFDDAPVELGPIPFIITSRKKLI